MSGSTPYERCSPPNDRRKPDVHSSKISTHPCASARRRTPSRNPGAGSCPRCDLHEDRPDVTGSQHLLERIEVVVQERSGRPGQPARHTGRFEAREQMTVERRVGPEVRREVPVVPAVVAAERHRRLAGRGASDANGDRARLAPRPSEPHHVRPRMHGDEAFGEVHLFRTVERREIAAVDDAADLVVNGRVAVAQDVGADPHQPHVDVFVAVEIPDAAALRPREVRRPTLRQVHLGALGKQHVAAGNDVFGALPQRLTRFRHVDVPAVITRQ